jgi:hypothetical protein
MSTMLILLLFVHGLLHLLGVAKAFGLAEVEYNCKDLWRAKSGC